jgi:hypothetical protein
LALGSIWMLVRPGELGGKVWGVVGILVCGSGTVAALRAAMKGQAWPRPAYRALRGQQLIVPVLLLFSLPWPLKLWFCVPLVAAWGILLPDYEDRR